MGITCTLPLTHSSTSTLMGYILFPIDTIRHGTLIVSYANCHVIFSIIGASQIIHICIIHAYLQWWLIEAVLGDDP